MVNLRQKIGERIHDSRMKQGWTREELSVRTNHSVSTERINNYEQGLRKPRRDALQALATALEVTPEYLLCLDDDSTRPQITPQAGITKSYIPVSQKFQLPAEDQELNTLIGKRIRALRNARGMSLAQLSELTGEALSKSRISNYEQGLRRPGIEAVTLIAHALGQVSPTYLLCLNDQAPLNDEEIKLIHDFRQLDQRGRNTVLESAQAHAKK